MIYYTAIEKFNSESGVLWEKYKAKNDLNHLVEIITLDSSLCPAAEQEGENEVLQDSNFPFGDAELYSDLKKSVVEIHGDLDANDWNTIAIELNPKKERALPPKDFDFVGYDLVDIATRTSTLVNCGKLEKAFTSADLNSSGLINDLESSLLVQRKIKDHYPNLSHNNTTVVAIWVKRN